jgi:HEAT repeat protein
MGLLRRKRLPKARTPEERAARLREARQWLVEAPPAIRQEILDSAAENHRRATVGSNADPSRVARLLEDRATREPDLAERARLLVTIDHLLGPDAAQRTGVDRRVGFDQTQSGKAEPDIEELVSNLKDRPFKVRAEALRMLGTRDDPRAIEAIAQCLNDRDGAVQSRAADVLRSFGERAVDVLLAELRGDLLADLPTLRALCAVGDERGVDGLLAVLRDASLDDDTRSETAIFLRQPLCYHAVEPWFDRIEASLAAFRSDRASLGFLLYEFNSHQREWIVVAGSALADFGDDVLEPLLVDVRDRDMLTRYQAVRPMTENEARTLVLELTRRRLEHVDS